LKLFWHIGLKFRVSSEYKSINKNINKSQYKKERAKRVETYEIHNSDFLWFHQTLGSSPSGPINGSEPDWVMGPSGPTNLNSAIFWQNKKRGAAAK
jgi:hypothetical protein